MTETQSHELAHYTRLRDDARRMVEATADSPRTRKGWARAVKRYARRVRRLSA